MTAKTVQVRGMASALTCALAAVSLFLLSAGQTSAGEQSPPQTDPVIGQAVFASPELAVQALHDAIEAGDKKMVRNIFGPDFADLIPMDPIDREDVDRFLLAYANTHTLIPEDGQRFALAIGEQKWTFPVPITKGDQGWYFDTATGAERVRVRQIGRNELGVIQATLAYYDAQKEYAEQDRNGDGVLEYAQIFTSAAGQRDGLYWEAEPGEPQSPLGPLFATGLPDDAYYGYNYRILKSQGAHAQGGAYDYVIGGRMIAGFALVAWPVEYGETGIMSFMVSHDGVVYENNLGPDGAAVVTAMEQFDPGAGWVPVQDAQAEQPGAGDHAQ
jgi:hypothetical protein